MWALEYGAWPEIYIDHIDGCQSNDKINNLRPATEKTNMRNLKRSSNNRSGCTGVFWNSQKSKWAATIKVNRKNIHLGFSPYFEVACALRKAAEDRYGFHPNHGRHS
ncbi:endonuclease [Sphingobium baderi LL03]|uniref:Endonuclease n=2 Tax=Sphingobium baderi TaxID=1332080 RepID=T0GQC0_9SPHN|nr:endonuclease [Sphingobium baderi LL03]